MVATKALTYISSMLVLFSLPVPIHAQQQGMGSSIICGTQIIGSGSTVTCNVNTWPLSSEKQGQLAELCQEENFGIIPPVLFMSKKTYNVGEIISIRYSGACPNKTQFLIVPQEARTGSIITVAMDRRFVSVPDYKGVIRFMNDRQSRPGMYVIRAYFVDGKGRRDLAAISLPFEVRSRF